MPYSLFDYVPGSFHTMGASVITTPTTADAIYCTGNEGSYDGKNTYWMANARQGCKINPQGVSKPMGLAITKAQYDAGLKGAPPGMTTMALGEEANPPVQPPVKYIVCEDGFQTKTPVGAQTLVDPCSGHYKCPATTSQPYRGKNCSYRLA